MSLPIVEEPVDSFERRRVRERARNLLFGQAESVTVGRFQLGRLIGAGAMGVVYEAYDPSLERTVAIKLIDSGAKSSPQRRARMLREARAMARLSHPNVVVIHEVGAEQERIFIAMEYVDGDNLRDWLRREPPTSDILRVMMGVGQGLMAAHRAGLVHRDMKPENVLIDRDGRPRLADFGVVREQPMTLLASLSAEQIMQACESTIYVTGAGALVGTPAYMAPEQLHGKVADQLSDQFAYCAVFYEALYGVRPYTGQDVGELAWAMLAQSVPSPAGASDVPDGIEALLRRGLSVAPKARFTSLEVLLERLASLLSQQPPAQEEPAAGRSPARIDADTAVLADAAVVGEAAADDHRERDDRADSAAGPRRRRGVVFAVVVALAIAGVVIMAAVTGEAPMRLTRWLPHPTTPTATNEPAAAAEAASASTAAPHAGVYPSAGVSTAGAAPGATRAKQEGHARAAPTLPSSSAAPPSPAGPHLKARGDGRCMQYCDRVGRCHYNESKQACVPADDTDCEQSATCRRLGRCVSNGHLCWASSAAGCRASQLCQAQGKCTSDGVECVSTAEGCRASDRCRTDGECTAQGSRCIAGKGDCANALCCTNEGRCSSNGHKCMAP